MWDLVEFLEYKTKMADQLWRRWNLIANLLDTMMLSLLSWQQLPHLIQAKNENEFFYMPYAKNLIQWELYIYIFIILFLYEWKYFYVKGADKTLPENKQIFWWHSRIMKINGRSTLNSIVLIADTARRFRLRLTTLAAAASEP